MFWVFRTNSEELRFAAIAKRKKDISNINYKCIQENERIMKEQRVQKREQAILDNLEILKSQVSLVNTLYKNNNK